MLLLNYKNNMFSAYEVGSPIYIHIFGWAKWAAVHSALDMGGGRVVALLERIIMYIQTICLMMRKRYKQVWKTFSQMNTIY